MPIMGSIAGTKFDSELDDSMANDKTNAELTLYLRVYLERVASGGKIKDADDVEFEVQEWGTTEWTAFKKKYQQQGQAYWHGKFWLQTPDDFDELDLKTHRPNIWCKFDLHIQDTPAGSYHKKIRVARLKKGGSNPAADTFRSHDSLYSNFDLGVASYVRGGKIYYQRTFIHEIGHAIGIPHIGVMTGEPACPASDTNSDECYGVKHSDRKNIMGFGMALSESAAKPWKQRIAEHTGTSESKWKVHMKRFYPRKLTSIVGGFSSAS